MGKVLAGAFTAVLAPTLVIVLTKYFDPNRGQSSTSPTTQQVVHDPTPTRKKGPEVANTRPPQGSWEKGPTPRSSCIETALREKCPPPMWRVRVSAGIVCHRVYVSFSTFTFCLRRVKLQPRAAGSKKVAFSARSRNAG